ncbi:Tyrosine-protein kinase HCK [Phytophthora cinnamomi]|uniref:Tyrosine-protein kinase HCK n=1 Tax=Phytophthora cinnamomi TaxID=4785 RepID=UPI00355972CF|nr:Tyrosine-protein kinase HCK [Phytophthora cinnamomi]
MLFSEVGNGFFKSTNCAKQYKKGNSYTNLLNHLRRSDNYEQDAQEVVCDRLPFACVERGFTRLNTALSLVSEDTLSKHIGPIFELLELRVARELLAAFGQASQAITVTMSRFNLAVKDSMKIKEELVAKVHALMPKFRTIKGRAVLRRVSRLSPLLRNDTRWPSTYDMVARYVKLQLAIIQLGHDLLVEHDVQSLPLRRTEHERVKALGKDLIYFEGVTQALQKSTLTMSAVRRLFDQVVKEYPALKAPLATTAQIVNNPHLEQGLVKLQLGEALTIAEKCL